MKVYARNTKWLNTPTKYSDVMEQECKRYKMKPVCDSYSLCRNDPRSLYLGNNNGEELSSRATQSSGWAYFPAGWKSIAAEFGGDPNKAIVSNGPEQNYYDPCFYKGEGNTDAACGTGPNSRQAYQAYQYAGFMCGAVNYKPFAAFRADLGARESLPARRYKFERVFVPEEERESPKSYKDLMLAECAKHGMKPVCDDKHACDGGLWIGNQHSLSHGSYRKNKSYNAEGWSKVEDQWAGLCTFKSDSSDAKQYCNLETYNERTSKSVNPNFMCGVVEMENGEDLLTAQLLSLKM